MALNISTQGAGGVFQFSLWTLEVWKKTSRIVFVLEKHWPAYNIVFIGICSCRKWLALKSVWSWPLLARVPVICTLYRVSLHNQTLPQQLKKWLQSCSTYKSLPSLMWQNQLGVFQVVTVGRLKHKRKNLFFFHSSHHMDTNVALWWESIGKGGYLILIPFL